MSLNRFEQMMFDYWESNLDERRHWEMKTNELSRQFPDVGSAAHAIERELWFYLLERSQHVPEFRRLTGGVPARVSLLNLAEHMIRLWRPLPAKVPHQRISGVDGPK